VEKLFLFFTVGHPGSVDTHAGVIVVAEFDSGKGASGDIQL